MSYIKIEPDNDHAKHIVQVDYALKELRKILKRDGIFEELKNREGFMSPSKKRRFKKSEAFKRKKREERKQNWFVKNRSSNEF